MFFRKFESTRIKKNSHVGLGFPTRSIFGCLAETTAPSRRPDATIFRWRLSPAKIPSIVRCRTTMSCSASLNRRRRLLSHGSNRPTRDLVNQCARISGLLFGLRFDGAFESTGKGTKSMSGIRVRERPNQWGWSWAYPYEPYVYPERWDRPERGQKKPA